MRLRMVHARACRGLAASPLRAKPHMARVHPETILGMRLDPCLRVFPTRADVPPPVIEALERGIAHSRDNPSTPGQDKLADLFGVNLDMRKELRLRMIGATDVRYAARKEAAKERRREHDKARKKAQRQDQGATPREQSIAATARAMGIEPDTLWRRLKREKEKIFAAKVQGDENATSHVDFSSTHLSRRERRTGDENTTPKARPMDAVDTDTRRARAERAAFVRTASTARPESKNLDIASLNAAAECWDAGMPNMTVAPPVRDDRAIRAPQNVSGAREAQNAESGSRPRGSHCRTYPISASCKRRNSPENEGSRRHGQTSSRLLQCKRRKGRRHDQTAAMVATICPKMRQSATCRR